MTRFNTYLLTEDRSKPIDEQKAKELINSKCTNILNKYKKTKSRIYRGKRGDLDYMLIAPGRGKLRRSHNTRNYYTLLIDNLKVWSAYPKRSRSIVCSTNIGKASGYGELYIVFPYNTAKIGVCPTDDIWDSIQSNYQYDLNTFNRMLQSLLEASTKWSNKGFDANWKNLTDVFKESEAMIQSLSWVFKKDERIGRYPSEGDAIYDIYNKIVNGKSYVQVLSDMLNPNTNNFKIETPKSINLSQDNHNEVWVGKSSSVLVHINNINDIL